MGGARDFNRASIPGKPPDVVEKVMSEAETEINIALTAAHAGPNWSNDTLGWILYLIALMMVRSQQQRENRRRPVAQIAEMLLENMLDTPERWDASKPVPAPDGPLPPNMSYEEAKHFRDSGAYRIELTTERHVLDEMEQVKAILPLLANRTWTRFTAPLVSGLFITTDNPVVLSYNDPEKIPPFYRQSPGPAHPDTSLYFAVSKCLFLLGTVAGHEGSLPSTPEITATMTMNTYVFTRSYGMAYAGAPTMRLINSANAVIDMEPSMLFEGSAG